MHWQRRCGHTSNHTCSLQYWDQPLHTELCTRETTQEFCWLQPAVPARSGTAIKVNGLYQLATSLTTTGTYMPYGITQCYLPPDRGDIPADTPAEAGTRLSNPRGMHSWVDLVGWLHTQMVYYPKMVTHPSTNWARRRVTRFMCWMTLTTMPRRQWCHRWTRTTESLCRQKNGQCDKLAVDSRRYCQLPCQCSWPTTVQFNAERSTLSS